MYSCTPMNYDDLCKVFEYNPDTGIIYWKRTSSKRSPARSVAGTKENKYIKIQYKGQSLKAHRLAWLLHTKKDPGLLSISHKNKNRMDNRIDNLRCLDTTELAYARSVRSDNNTGRRGIKRMTDGRYKSMATMHGKSKYLGFFNTLEEAVEARSQFILDNNLKSRS